MGNTPFDWFEFEQAVSDLGMYLLELKYIDDALAFLKSDQCQAPAPMVKYTLGHTAPVTQYASPIDDGLDDQGEGWLSMSQVDERLEELATEATNWGHEQTNHLRDRYRPMIKPVVEDYTEVATTLRDLAATVESGNAIASGTTGWGLDLSKWEGDAALQFQRGFVTPFAQVVDNHRLGLLQSAACVASGRAVVIGCQNAMMNLVVTARDKAKEQLEARANNGSGGISADFLSVVSTGLIVVGTIASATGAGAAPGAALVVVGTGLGYASTQVPDDSSETRTITLEDAETSWANIMEEVERLRTTYERDWDTIDESARQVKVNIAADEDDGLLHPPPPAVDGATPEGFHHDTSVQYA